MTIIKVLLVVIFSLSVVAKLSGKTRSTFDNAGFAPIVMYIIAIAEILLTIGLFTQNELWATVGLLAIMGGAFFTLFRQKARPDKYRMAFITALLLLALLTLQVQNHQQLSWAHRM